MDETKETQGVATSGDTKGTSEKEPKTYTEEEKVKAVSDALSTAGRTAKQLEQLKETLEVGKKQLTTDRTQWRKEQDEEKLESIRDNPDALKDFRAEQKRRDRDAELDKREHELKDREETATEALKEADKGKKERNALVIAQKHDVDVESLVKFTDGSAEAMEDLARVLPKKGEAKPPIKPDSGTTTGSDTMPDSAKGKMRAGWDDLHKS